jgi:hypothetical protein
MLFGQAPALDPPVVYYQRLLARDQEEATEVVEEYVKDHALDTVYDEVLIPALLLAWQDRKQGLLAGDDEAFILQATQDIMAEIGAASSDPGEGAQATGGVTEVPGAAPVLILGCPAHHEAEEVIVQMLQQIMQPTGCHVDVMSTRTHASDIAAHIRQEHPALIFIVALPGGLPQTRYLCRHLHREFPDLHIVVGYWGDKEEFDKILVRLRQAGASSLTTSLLQSRSRISALTTDIVPQPQLPSHDREIAEAR